MNEIKYNLDTFEKVNIIGKYFLVEITEDFL